MIYQLIRYSIVGFSNAAIDIGVLNLLVQVFGWQLIPANTIAAALAIANGYVWHKYWTFNDRRPNFLHQLPLFIAVNVVWIVIYDLLVHFGTLWLMNEFPDWRYWWQYNLAKVVSAVIFTVCNYITYKFIIFKQRD
jgi:putative flippase GtrA